MEVHPVLHDCTCQRLFPRSKPLTSAWLHIIGPLPCSDQFCIDIVGMLSIGKALQGGDSRWVSSITIHNELLRRGRQVRNQHLDSSSDQTD
jgi:hypothetical protein